MLYWFVPYHTIPRFAMKAGPEPTRPRGIGDPDGMTGSCQGIDAGAG